MSFPSSVPSYTGFTSSHTLSQDQHAAQHNAEQADIVALAQKLGTGASTPVGNSVLRGNGSGTTAYDQVHLNTDVTNVLSTANGGTGQNSLTSLPLINPSITGGGSWTGAPVLSGPVISDFTNANHHHDGSSGGGTLNGQNAIQAGTLTGDRLASNTVTPDKMLGIDMFGVGPSYTASPPAAGSGQFYIQAGTSVSLTNGASGGGITFPTPFPNGILSVVICDGDGNPTRVVSVIGSQVSTTGVGFVYQGVPNTPVRTNYIAIGW